MEQNTLKPRRFWRPRFRLRTLFVVVTVVAFATWQFTWIYQRREQRKCWPFLLYASNVHEPESTILWVRAPSALWLFGEEGIGAIWLDNTAGETDRKRIRRLFPESKIHFTRNRGNGHLGSATPPSATQS